MTILIVYIIYYSLFSFSSSAHQFFLFLLPTGSSNHHSALCPAIPFLLRFHTSCILQSVIPRQDRLLLLSLYPKQPTLLFSLEYGLFLSFLYIVPIFASQVDIRNPLRVILKFTILLHCLLTAERLMIYLYFIFSTSLPYTCSTNHGSTDFFSASSGENQATPLFSSSFIETLSSESASSR